MTYDTQSDTDADSGADVSDGMVFGVWCLVYCLYGWSHVEIQITLICTKFAAPIKCCRILPEM
jgi:hypothetical protein